jgi:hypothetical protein
MTTRRPSLLILAAAAGLVAGLLGGTGVVLAERPPVSPNASPQVAPAASAPFVLPPTASRVGAVATGVGVAPAAAGTATAGTAIAYPYFGGAPGIAPDDTIVVTGVGQAETKADGSNRQAAEKAAIADALADARTQAEAIASGTDLTITGTLWVSAAVSPGYGVMPMAVNEPAVDCPVQPPVDGKSAPEPVCPPSYQPTLAASVTVAYRVSR